MSEAEEYDSVRVSAEGVRVLKRFAADRFPVPAIEFEISSGRDQQVSLTLSDRVPDGVDVDDLGFHPDYGSEHWTIKEDRITFERDLEQNESYTTVYGVRTAEDVEQFLTEPEVESVEPPLPVSDDDVVLESDDALVEDAISGDIEPEETEETTEEPEVPSTLDLGSPGDSPTADDGAAVDEKPAIDEEPVTDERPAVDGLSVTDRSEEPEPVDTPADGSLVGALAAEIREDNVPREDVELLRSALSEVGQPSGSTTARLDRLQQDVADLRAYTTALEEFLDEEGTGEELIESFDARLEQFQEEVTAFGNRLDHLETEFVVDVRGRIEDLETEFEELESEVTSDLDRLDELEQRTDRVAERADSADARTTDLVRRLDDTESTFDSRLDDIESKLDRVDDIESKVDGLDEIRSELDRLDETRSEFAGRLDDIESELDRLDDIETLESELEEIQQWRRQLINTLGG